MATSRKWFNSPGRLTGATVPLSRFICKTKKLGIAVDREYDVFEVYPNGDLLWRQCVTGLENARLKVSELGKLSSNQFFATHTPTKEIVAQVNHEQTNGA
jgi:hypothetical protein